MAPGSTKNKRRERDPEIHQTTKGNQWYVGMKAHIGVDAKSGLTHSLKTTPANPNKIKSHRNPIPDQCYLLSQRKKSVITDTCATF
jgi:IS5 family transposase